jgi:hypothetical protein
MCTWLGRCIVSNHPLGLPCRIGGTLDDILWNMLWQTNKEEEVKYMEDLNVS